MLLKTKSKNPKPTCHKFEIFDFFRIILQNRVKSFLSDQTRYSDSESIKIEL